MKLKRAAKDNEPLIAAAPAKPAAKTGNDSQALLPGAIAALGGLVLACALLGFGLSDYIEKPFRAYFFHVNARHHSLALIETGSNGMHHLMVELFSLDDVGQAYDIVQQEDRVNVTLGRHTNDLMTSFYARSPSAFMVECGWGGREIDPANWTPFEMHDGPSLWGHERVWLSPEDRAVAREMRMRAAAEGKRAPVQVMEGNFKLMSGTCPWWDGVKDA